MMRVSMLLVLGKLAFMVGLILIASAVRADKQWHFQRPIVLSSSAPPKNVDRLPWMLPAGFCWCDKRLVLGVVIGIKASATDLKYQVWAEDGDGVWRLVKTLDGVGYSSELISLGNHVGIVGHVGGDPRLGAHNAIQFFCIPLDGKEVSCQEIHPRFEAGRVFVCGVSVWQDSIQVFLLREFLPGLIKPGAGGRDLSRDLALNQRRNELLLARSRDNGKTWGELIKIANTTMPKEGVFLPVLQWSADGFGKFVLERNEKLIFLFTEDGGKTWNQIPVRLRDDEGDDVLRVPLAAANAGEEFVMAYLAHKPRRERKGHYYLTRSKDCKMWTKGIRIAEQPVTEDPSWLAKLAVAGDRLAFTYVAVLGSWVEGNLEWRLMLSEDRGKHWTRAPLEKFYRGVGLFSALTFAPSGDRLVWANSIVANLKTDPTYYLVVQEYSPKVPPPQELSPEQAKLVRTLIEQLADNDFAVREAATQKLAAFGVAAKKELLAVRDRTADPEVKRRLEQVLARIFPPALRLE